MAVFIEGFAETDNNLRLDVYVSDILKLLSRSQFKNRFVKATVNGRAAKASRLLKHGDRYVIELKDEEDVSAAGMPEEIPLQIVYEDKNVIVLDKPQGMVVHPAHGNWSGTLANALLWHFKTEPGLETLPRAGLVHRLDKDTSGLIIAGKNAKAQDFLAAQFRNRTVKKTYLAISRGVPAAESGIVDNWLARDEKNRKRFAPAPEGRGKRAISEWKVLASTQNYAILELGLKTGRTHQLRVHCKTLLCPILGDPVYGAKDRLFPDASLMLHAYKLAIRLPGHDEQSEFSAAIPERFRYVIEKLGLDTRQCRTVFPWQH